MQGAEEGFLERQLRGKEEWRARQRELPYPEKVSQVIDMQERVAPMLAARGVHIVPWKRDHDPSDARKQGFSK